MKKRKKNVSACSFCRPSYGKDKKGKLKSMEHKYDWMKDDDGGDNFAAPFVILFSVERHDAGAI